MRFLAVNEETLILDVVVWTSVINQSANVVTPWQLIWWDYVLRIGGECDFSVHNIHSAMA